MCALNWRGLDFPSMDYNLDTSLKSTCLIKIATSILDCLDVRIKAWKTFCLVMPDAFMYERRKKWIPVEKCVLRKGKGLPLPNDFITEFARYCSAASWELFLWLDFHVSRCKIKLIPTMPENFVWKRGMIDRKETALLLVKDIRLDTVERYKLACLYCLESDIVAFWNQLHISQNFTHTLTNNNLDTLPLVSYWSHHVDGKLKLLRPSMMKWCSSDDPTPYEYAFRISVDIGNEVAVRYFFGKLNSVEKEKLLLETVEHMKEIPYDFHYLGRMQAGILYFCLQSLDEEKQSDLFHLNPSLVFLRFLEWPLQSLFIKVVQEWISYLSETVCHCLLESIATKAYMGCKDFDYQQLYGQFWKLITPSCKKYMMNFHMDGPCILYLYDMGDQKNIALLFEEMSSVDREAFIFDYTGKSFCKRLISNYQFEVLKFFILLCIPSREKALEFRNILLKWQLKELCNSLSKNKGNSSERVDSLISYEAYQQFGQAVESLDDLLREKYKRKKAEDAHESAKKYCTEGTKNCV